MAIARSVPPQVIASGIVVSVQERAFENKRTGWRLTLAQESGAQMVVAVTETGTSDYAAHTLSEGQLPKIGTFVAYDVQVAESREYGASLRYAGSAAGVLDYIHSRIQPAKAA